MTGTAGRAALASALLLVAGCSGPAFDRATEACSDRATGEIDVAPGDVWETMRSDEPLKGAAETVHVDGTLDGQDYHCSAHRDRDGWRVTEFGLGTRTSTPAATPTGR